MLLLEEMDLDDLRAARAILIMEANLADPDGELNPFQQSVLKGLMGAICRIGFDHEALASLNTGQLAQFNAAANEANRMQLWYEENKHNVEVWLEQSLENA